MAIDVVARGTGHYGYGGLGALVLDLEGDEPAALVREKDGVPITPILSGDGETWETEDDWIVRLLEASGPRTERFRVEIDASAAGRPELLLLLAIAAFCGTVEHFGLHGEVDIIMGTMGRALGCFGAFVAGSRELRELLINRARSFMFTTALPPSVLASALEALRLLDKEPAWRNALWDNVSFFKNGLKTRGFNTRDSETPIIPIVVGDASLAVTISESLLQEGLFIQAIRPPTVPEGSSRLRITVSAAHTKGDLSWALEILERVCKKHKVI